MNITDKSIFTVTHPMDYGVFMAICNTFKKHSHVTLDLCLTKKSESVGWDGNHGAMHMKDHFGHGEMKGKLPYEYILQIFTSVRGQSEFLRTSDKSDSIYSKTRTNPAPSGNTSMS